jgi:hypothetical protein
MSSEPNTGNNGHSEASSTQAEFVGLQQQLHSLRSRIQRNTRFTGIVTLALMVLLLGYFYYAGQLWAEVTQPEKLIDLADDKIKESLPGLRDSLEKRVVKDAPSWAEGLSKQALDSVPKARKRFEEYVLEQMNTSIEHARMVGTAEFQKFVATHRPKFEQHIKELANDPKAADRTLEELITDLEKDQEVNLKIDMGELLKTLKECNEHWRYLLAGKDLDEEARLERRTWMLARRLQMGLSETPSTVEGKAAPKSANPSKGTKQG